MRARIAQFMLGSDRTCARLGAITLRPHQQWAVSRVERALDEFGGVLICDDVGLGKTFVATAIARRFFRSVVVAPAALKSMWRAALEVTETTAEFLTFEALSRAKPARHSRTRHDLVIVDEAHHSRNRATRRYHRLAELAREARVVLLTATPIHNDRSEMIALLSLFLGSRATALGAAELARCVVRRERSDLADEIAIPEIVRARDREISDDPGLVQELIALPPPLPVRDGGIAGALIARGLVHQWASSEAALHEAVRRRIARAAALCASLESGNYPTATELKTWIYGEGSLQLGFPELLSSPIEDAPTLLDSVRAHADALKDFHSRRRAEATLDAERAGILHQIRSTHPGSRIVAFAQYAETVSMLYGRLAHSGRVAMLDARGGLVAGGKLTRDETLVRFSPRALNANAPPPSERIDLLLTTDLLSEGVNLQDADVVVHLDLPWTAARLEQRVGRVARFGSLHSHVHVYLLRPPASAAALLRSEVIVQQKWVGTKDAIGSSSSAPFANGDDFGSADVRPESVAAKAQRLHAILDGWSCPLSESDRPAGDVATVRSPRAGFAAAISVDDRPLLLACIAGHVSTNLDIQIQACLLCEGAELNTDRGDYEAAVTQVHAWFEHDLASAAAGVSGSHGRARKRILSRLDSTIQNAPPHIRTIRSRLASRARNVATTRHGAAVERELEALAQSTLPDKEWLEAISALRSTRTERSSVPAQRQDLQIHAVILLSQHEHHH